MATDGGGGVVDGRARQKWPLTEGAGWWMAESPVATEKLAVRTMELMVPALSKY
jgi:hypothetical protein